MKTKLYYFSGTGNSLFVGKKLQAELEGSELISIPQVMIQSEIEGESIGIITPIYMYNVPHIVADFIKKIKDVKYLFIVYSGAGELGYGIKRTKKLLELNNLKFSAIYNVTMPSNYTPYGCPSESERQRILEEADEKIAQIPETIKNQLQHFDKSTTSFFKSFFFPGMLYKLGYKFISNMAKSFTTTHNCDGCGICKQVCPVNNITIIESKPVWGNKCQQCYACLQWCPKHAIELGKKTEGIERYTNPKIKVKEMVNAAAITN